MREEAVHPLSLKNDKRLKVIIVSVDERFTSQTCANLECWKALCENGAEPLVEYLRYCDDGSVDYRHLYCPHCGTVWNRDKVAAKSMIHVALFFWMVAIHFFWSKTEEVLGLAPRPKLAKQQKRERAAAKKANKVAKIKSTRDDDSDSDGYDSNDWNSDSDNPDTSNDSNGEDGLSTREDSDNEEILQILEARKDNASETKVKKKRTTSRKRARTSSANVKGKGKAVVQDDENDDDKSGPAAGPSIGSQTVLEQKRATRTRSTTRVTYTDTYSDEDEDDEDGDDNLNTDGEWADDD